MTQAAPAMSQDFQELRQWLIERRRSLSYHTAWAVEKSETRRKLVEEGKYLPKCYSMIWPRHSLIRWVEPTKGNRP
ncbi:MAG: hypothetical protein WBK77_07940 [Alphaproteobacteria bacterium]